MDMHDNVLQEMRKIEQQMHQDNRKLVALRLVLKEYATEEYPGAIKLNLIATECVRNHGGSASFQQIIECIEDHQIIIPRNRLSLVLTKNPELEYDKKAKMWKIVENLTEPK